MISASRRQTALSLVLFLFLSPLFRSAPSAAAQTANYAELTRTAIGHVDKAVELVKAGDTVQAEDAIKQTKDSLAALLDRTQQLQNIANREHDRCVQNQGELEKRVNDLYNQREQESQKMMEFQAKLAEASKGAQLSADEYGRLQGQLNATRESIRQTQEKLEELKKWWWVPGYGQYLAIRTLADHDIENEGRLIRYLSEQQNQLQQSRADLEASRQLMRSIHDQRRQTESLMQDLGRIERENQRQLVQFKRSSVFLTDVAVFWGKASNSLDVNGNDFITTIGILQKELAETGGFQFPGEGLQSGANFREALLNFANSIDNKTSFLLNPATSYCGGPPPQQALAVRR
jgi:hypothetical protein